LLLCNQKLIMAYWWFFPLCFFFVLCLFYDSQRIMFWPMPRRWPWCRRLSPVLVIYWNLPKGLSTPISVAQRQWARELLSLLHHLVLVVFPTRFPPAIGMSNIRRHHHHRCRRPFSALSSVSASAPTSGLVRVCVRAAHSVAKKIIKSKTDKRCACRMPAWFVWLNISILASHLCI